MCSHKGLPKTGFQNSAQLRPAGGKFFSRTWENGAGQIFVYRCGGGGSTAWLPRSAELRVSSSCPHSSRICEGTRVTHGGPSTREEAPNPDMGAKWSCCLRWGLFSWLMGLQPGPCLPHGDGGEQPTNTVLLSPGNTGALSGSF